MAFNKIKVKIRDFDWIIAILSIILATIGVVIIYSITVGKEGNSFPQLAVNQIVFVCLGILTMVFFVFFDYRLLKNFTAVLYFLMIALLVLVLFIGKGAGGATRWINLGFFQLQPSEISKIILIIVLAKYFSSHQKDIYKFRHIVISGIFVAVPLFLVASQPDLGTALVFVVIWGGMLLISGIRNIYIFLTSILGLAFLPIFWYFLKDYQKNRILTFLNPTADPLGEGYNVIQSKIAIGSGKLLGRGLGHGSQSYLNFLPQAAQHTDFIFAVLAEELGFLGAILLLGLFFILLIRGLRIARLARDNFGMLLSMGIVVMFTFQILINVGMNLGLMPITGIPLPFVSYGGSSMVLVFCALGILQNVIVRHRQIAF